MNAFDEAAARVSRHKAAVLQAQAALYVAESEMLALMPSKPEGSVTERGLHYKVSVTYGFNRSVDDGALAFVREQVESALLEQAIRYKPAIDLAGLRSLMVDNPDAYAIIAQAITAKPAKPSVRVEEIVNNVGCRDGADA